jgi:hypothetical protein
LSPREQSLCVALACVENDPENSGKLLIKVLPPMPAFCPVMTNPAHLPTESLLRLPISLVPYWTRTATGILLHIRPLIRANLKHYEMVPQLRIHGCGGDGLKRASDTDYSRLSTRKPKNFCNSITERNSSATFISRIPVLVSYFIKHRTSGWR